MSELLELQQQLQDTSATIARLEKALAASPGSLAVQLNLRSVLKRFSRLEQEFGRIADEASLDVCTYRLFASSESKNRISLRGLSSALQDFQLAFSSLFDALKNGRRLRSRLTPDILEATSFDFGYAFPGSVGVVLTLPRERLLLGGDLLNDTVTTFFSLAHAPSHDEITEKGRRLGPAPLRAIYKWALAHVEGGLGADITWRHGSEEPSTLFIQQPELERLRTEIAATSEESTEVIAALGRLTGADTQTRRFRFEPDGCEAVTGTFVDAIDETHTVTLPSRYRARLEKTTKIQYSSEEEQVAWHLLSLDRP